MPDRLRLCSSPKDSVCTTPSMALSWLLGSASFSLLPGTLLGAVAGRHPVVVDCTATTPVFWTPTVDVLQQPAVASTPGRAAQGQVQQASMQDDDPLQRLPLGPFAMPTGNSVGSCMEAAEAPARAQGLCGVAFAAGLGRLHDPCWQHTVMKLWG